MDVDSVLRGEFDADEGSFLLQLRTDLYWDAAAFRRLTAAMLEYVRHRNPEDAIPRWIAEGYWYLDTFVKDWSSHPHFPRLHDAAYYTRAYTRLHDLAYWLFVGESPHEAAAGFEPV